MGLNYDFYKIKEASPVSVLLKFSSLRGSSDLIFQYSKYINGEPGSGKTKSRQTYELAKIQDFSVSFEQEIQSLKIDEELAIHSIIRRSGSKFHLPLIDFYEVTENELFTALCNLQEDFNYDIYLFKSGRSFHGYIDTLFTNEEWFKFLGKLLLLNRTSQIVDSLWVGHSLVNGYSSLRLSCNTSLYKSYPIFWQKLPNERQHLPIDAYTFKRSVKNEKRHKLFRRVILGAVLLAFIEKLAKRARPKKQTTNFYHNIE